MHKLDRFISSALIYTPTVFAGLNDSGLPTIIKACKNHNFRKHNFILFRHIPSSHPDRVNIIYMSLHHNDKPCLKGKVKYIRQNTYPKHIKIIIHHASHLLLVSYHIYAFAKLFFFSCIYHCRSLSSPHTRIRFFPYIHI